MIADIPIIWEPDLQNSNERKIGKRKREKEERTLFFLSFLIFSMDYSMFGSGTQGTIPKDSFIQVPRQKRISQAVVSVPTARVNCFKYAFVLTVARIWNWLAIGARQSKAIEPLESSLRHIEKTLFY